MPDDPKPTPPPEPPPESLSRNVRPDGRHLTTPALVHHHLRTLRPRLAFDPDFSRPAFARWKTQLRARQRKLLNFPRTPAQPAPVKISSEPRDGYRLERWEIYPEPFSVVPVLLLVPDGATKAKRAPAVLCLPGTDHPKERLAGEPEPAIARPNPFPQFEDMARRFVRAGFVALAMDNPGTAELHDPRSLNWTRQVFPLIWLNRPYEALSVFQKFRALRWLKTLPFVDRSRLAVSGHSLGAKPALHLGLLDADVKAVVWNDHLSYWRHVPLLTNLNPVAPWHYIPDFINWFDYPDLMAALAPTPLLITEGGRSEHFRTLRKAYAIAGKPNNVRLDFMPNFRDPASRKLDRVPIPESINGADYGKYFNFDGDHYFKGDVAVPWVKRMLGVR
ncbi:MAG: hypothetical protein NTW19_18200 [Planctomycetota bacterium]|nr:hypothetical protein [Planctomycetota bacterium]